MQILYLYILKLSFPVLCKFTSSCSYEQLAFALYQREKERERKGEAERKERERALLPSYFRTGTASTKTRGAAVVTAVAVVAAVAAAAGGGQHLLSPKPSALTKEEYLKIGKWKKISSKW